MEFKFLKQMKKRFQVLGIDQKRNKKGEEDGMSEKEEKENQTEDNDSTQDPKTIHIPELEAEKEFSTKIQPEQQKFSNSFFTGAVLNTIYQNAVKSEFTFSR